MATVGSVLTMNAQTATPIPAQPGVTAGPQAAVGSSEMTQQSDSVTLMGGTAESQETAYNENGGTQLGEASAFFLAEQQSFRAANGSGGNQSATASTVPHLPVKTRDEATVGAGLAGSAPSAQTAPNANQRSVGVGDSAANPAALSGAVSSATTTSSASSENAAAETPIAELAQLDDTLQQMGIDPQSISLFNRMAMLLYANDPAALRVLVQTMQTGAQQLTAANSGGADVVAGAQSATSAPSAGPSSGQTQPAPAENSQAQEVQADAGQTEVSLAQPAIGSQATGDDSVAAGQPLALPAAYIATSSDSGQTSPTATPGGLSQSNTLVAQLDQLNSTFATVEGGQFKFLQQNAESGQLLNVSA
jgi:hypothetical protein